MHLRRLVVVDSIIVLLQTVFVDISLHSLCGSLPRLAGPTWLLQKWQKAQAGGGGWGDTYI